MTLNIPKIIHYVWLGGKEKPQSVINCIESWKRVCPDYEIKEWNESNFDLSSCQYAQQAYDAKKYAFAADFIRLCVVYKYGGVYMDTDEELVQPLDRFLCYDYFSSFENSVNLQMGLLGAKPQSKFVEYLISYYDGHQFILPHKKYDMTANVLTTTHMVKNACGLKLNNSNQLLDFCGEKIMIFTNDYFCPKDYYTGKINITENTYAIHHYAGSWLDKKGVFINRLCHFIYKLVGERFFKRLTRISVSISLNNCRQKYIKRLKFQERKKKKENRQIAIAENVV